MSPQDIVNPKFLLYESFNYMECSDHNILKGNKSV